MAGDANGGEARSNSRPPVSTDSPLLALLPHALRLLRREPALGITLAYLLVALAGISYASSFYRQFDIPILSLMQISDFLVAGIQQPVALLLVLSTVPICWLMDRWNMRVFSRQVAAYERLSSRERLAWWQRLRLRYLAWHILEVRRGLQLQVAYVLVVVLYGSLFVSLYAEYQARKIKRGDAAEMTVWLNGESAPLAASASPTWTYLGAVGNYVFLYDRQAARAQVVPVNALARVQPLPRPRAARKRPLVVPIP